VQLIMADRPGYLEPDLYARIHLFGLPPV